jgi:hypothetical protein
MASTSNLLAEARAKYHELMIGQSARVVVDEYGQRVEYTAANATRLMQYIQRLENELLSTSNQPMRPYF